MSLGPIIPGRIPNSFIYSRSQNSLTANARLLQQLQDQISTGKQFQYMGDDPAAAIKTFALQQTLERKDQVSLNVEVDRSLLASSEDTMGKIGDVFSQTKSFILSGLGNLVSPTEKLQMANEVGTLIQKVTNLANTNFRGRYLFGGSNNTTSPFVADQVNDAIQFSGDFFDIKSFVSFDGLLSNNVNPEIALKPFAQDQGTDLDPLLTAGTRIDDLFAGRGLALGSIEVTVDTGGGPQTEIIDLTTANSIQDIITRIEAPFAGDLTVSVGDDGLDFTPSAGTVAIDEVQNSRVAANLGIKSAAAASITGSDLNPGLSIYTNIADLNNGTGIGATAGNGLVVQNGIQSTTIDLDGLTTLEDLFNAFKVADIDLEAGISDDASGLTITSRLSGVGFSVGENNGLNATSLGIRTLASATPLAELNLGQGVPVDGVTELDITRRDGTEISISLTGTKTIQDVLDEINSFDTGNLVASLNTTGNGITISDNSGTGSLIINENAITTALGIDGTVDGNEDILGSDVGAASISTLLSALNEGAGVPVGTADLIITRRDGSTETISLAAATTVQDVLTIVNAVDPGNLILTHNASTQGFTLNDNSGTGALTVTDNVVSAGLGINDSEDGIVDFVGSDTNRQRAGGIIDLLFRLRDALSNGDNAELESIDQRLNTELEEFNFARGSIAGRLRALDDTANAIADE
ncbi:MAG: hypothetical protein JKY95_18140, partial [Planctomycetaceae bacterium]|nr:hypothetical protein [Planctomycetaceae bacterium]